MGRSQRMPPQSPQSRQSPLYHAGRETCSVPAFFASISGPTLDTLVVRRVLWVLGALEKMLQVEHIRTVRRSMEELWCVANDLPAFDSALVRWRTTVHGTPVFPAVVWLWSLRADPAYGGLDPP
jgi:hypothetical protein